MSTSLSAGGKTGKRLTIALLFAALVAGGGYVGWQLAQRQADTESSTNNADEAYLAETAVSDYLRSLKLQVLPGGKIEGNRPTSSDSIKEVAVSGQRLTPVVFSTKGESPVTYAVSAVNFELKPNSGLDPDDNDWDNGLLLLMKKQGGRFVVVSAEPVSGTELESGKISLVQTGSHSWGWTSESINESMGYDISNVEFYGAQRDNITALARLRNIAFKRDLADCTDSDPVLRSACIHEQVRLTAKWKFIEEGEAFPLEVRWSGTLDGDKVNVTHRIAPDARGGYAFPKKYNDFDF